MMKKARFIPKLGQTDYTHVRWVPVINCVLRYKNKILLVERSKNLKFHPGCWSGISGFLDDKKSLKQKVTEEIKEELGIPKNKIENIRLGEIFDQEDQKAHKTWIVHPILVDVNTDRVRLDWEARKYVWTSPHKARELKLLPGFSSVLKNLGL